MYDDTITTGGREGGDEPRWEPLEAFLPRVLCGPFMWMHGVRLEDGRLLQAYKHADTRAYLLLDDEADAWEWLPGGVFRRMRHSEAIEFVFDAWWLLETAQEDERIAVTVALKQAWERGNGDHNAGAHILPCSPASGFRTLPRLCKCP